MIALLFLTISCPNGAVTMGVDVSQFQGTIDWSMVRGGGYAYAFIRATNGTALTDSQFATNWSNAGTNGIIRGAYHFFEPQQDPVTQADFFVQTAGVPQAGDLPLALDFEILGGLTGAQATAAALSFLQRVQQTTGRTPILFISTSFFNSLGAPSSLGAYTLWTPDWNVTCPNIPNPPWTSWLFWQSADNGTVAGISGTVDIDKFNGSLLDLQNFVFVPFEDGGVPGDGGSGIDAPTDAAFIPEVCDQPPDASPPIDAARRDAPATGPDAAANGASSDAGCSCSIARSQTPPVWLLLALVSGWRLRRAATRSRRR